MFTGIIQEQGVVKAIQKNDQGQKFTFGCPGLQPQIELGDSVCSNGVCLSATELTFDGFSCYAVSETLAKTNLGSLSVGSPVNFELSMLATTRIGGHFVSGHIDTTAGVSAIVNFPDDSAEVSLEIPSEYIKYCIPKGSIGINGVSLTIAERSSNSLKVALIPMTLAKTNLGHLAVNDRVNIEVDMTGKYIESFLQHYLSESPTLFKDISLTPGT